MAIHRLKAYSSNIGLKIVMLTAQPVAVSYRVTTGTVHFTIPIQQKKIGAKNPVLTVLSLHGIAAIVVVKITAVLFP